MKLLIQNVYDTEFKENVVHFPLGLIGLSDLKTFDLASLKDSWPLMSLNSTGEEKISFLVVEPHSLIENYDVDLTDDDIEFLEIKAVEDVLVLAIVTVRSLQPQIVTANLAGPLIINRVTSTGKQVILANADSYSTEHALISEQDSRQEPESRP